MTGLTASKLTGRRVFAIFVAAFGVIVAVNLVLAVEAVKTFPGLEVANSYVASQTFDRDRKAQEALGWTVVATVSGGRLRLAITGRDGLPVEPAGIAATLGRATEVSDDRAMDLSWDGASFVAPADVAPGYWNLRLEARAADGTVFRQRLELVVRG